jgi:23S rRNA (adenine2503-C2)-methyltransferase
MQTFIYDLTLTELKEWLAEQQEPEYRAGQIFEWLYKKRVDSFEAMTNLSKSLRQRLADSFSLKPLDQITLQVSQDGTMKFLFGLHDGHAIETVIMKHDYGNSVCVTTQVGCRMGCTFCASTIGGMRRNLTSGEVVAQVVEAQRALDMSGERVSSIVVMGSGEPFENFNELIQFFETVINPHGFHIGQRHITVSTVGIVPKIYEFADLGMQITLAVSLHAPNETIRAKLMPVNRRYPFADLLAACRYYVEKTGRRITFEYALIGGVNDKAEHAEELAELLKDLKCHVNLIPVNYVPERKYVRTSRKDIFQFLHVLEKHGINATIRREHGSDIAAACGQLRAQHLSSTAR